MLKPVAPRIELHSWDHQCWRDAVNVVKWAFDTSWVRFRNNWNVDTQTRRVAYIYAALTSSPPGAGVAYRVDGSRTQVLPAQQASFAEFKPGDPVFRSYNRYVFIGMRRLATLARQHDIRIIVYESPIAPAILRRRAGRLSLQAQENRDWFNAGCSNSAVACVQAPALPEVRGVNWPDCCHAPAQLLGLYLVRLVNTPRT